MSEEETLPPVGLRPRWLADEMRAAEIAAAVGRYEAAGRGVPAEWRDELAVLTGDPTEPLPLAEQARDLLLRVRELEATARNAVTWMDAGFPERAEANLRRVLDGDQP